MKVAYGSYQELLEDSKIDIVYISLPHRYHYEWIKKAFASKKAVMSEKPAALNAEEIKEIVKLSEEQRLFFMEGMKSRFNPAYEKMKQLVAQGIIGEVLVVETSLCKNIPPENPTYHYEVGQGGCLLDLGVYNISFFTDFVRGPLTINRFDSRVYPNGVEIYVKVELTNKETRILLETGFDNEKPAIARIIGTKGTITAPNFYRMTSFSLKKRAGEETTFNLPYLYDDFYGEIAHATQCLIEKKLESNQMTRADSIRSAQIVDAIKRKLP